MKILQLLPYSFYGGPETQIFSLAAELRRQFQIETELVLLHSSALKDQDRAIAEQRALAGGVRCSWILSPGIFNFFKIRQQLLTRFQTGQFTHLVSSGYVGDLLSQNLPVTKIAYHHGWTAQSLKMRVYEWLDQRSLSQFNQVVCVSEAQLEAFKKIYAKVTLLKNALTLEDLPAQKTRTELLQRFKIPSTAKILMSLGRLSPEKNPELAIEIMSDPKIRQQEIYWVWFGGGLEFQKLQELKTTLKLEKMIFAGHEPLASQWLATADVFVLTSLTEGLPIALLEAMLSKKPILSSSVGGIPEVIENSRNGILCGSKMAHEFVRAILQLTSQPELSRQLGEAGQKSALQKNERKTQTENWLKILKTSSAE